MADHVLAPGAAGFVGRRVVRTLTDAGTTVAELDSLRPDYTSTNFYGTSVLLSEPAAAGGGTLVLASAKVAHREGSYRCDTWRGPGPARDGTAVSRAEACGA